MSHQTLHRTCPICRKKRQMKLVHQDDYTSHEDPRYSYTNRAYLLQCLHCKLHSMFLTHSNEHDEDVYFDDFGTATRIWPERPFFVPPAPTRDDPEWISRLQKKTETIHKDLISIYVALDNKLYKLAAVGIRTLFEDIAHEDGALKKLHFNKKLDALEASGRITKVERESLEVLVESGNAATHRSWNPKCEDVEILLPIVESYIYRVYIKADDEAAAQEAENTRRSQVQSLKNRLPPDTRKTPTSKGSP